ncbi:bifunctional phosphoribosyl-AMP cyclohydrolase/phosphoribosyl-ATP diphosphatase HisIE [Heyndrickxia sporothermodurans]|uniref:Histidine biosynthesis bifunctional protein HisIE n=1 Tax=Heyndrickxia sporothermodurans TaxID=46224 RepID=A0A150L876_9BACI|nr:bifunctional phosphoribosyl-AMP cyclohydrolase/phosphoribosyl-ATP diphosphatase HisIE [Heyndrickxia sporothermodurans]KYD08465.1 Phosphoribosyl-AMP cyclohydrolase [Heyndrickxia sporothermodurans]MED3650183.1 bifunctional phosphoribosyl-AMP cyclohydrolase/phosphoribosyl-ATP diphosphatase HisIE [Heyndrickxia sporothermodurans]MED3700005.1 bifunctional phosphoribosyl-AMP cyclohydrolase/phosphoribosyl-ATP diphosphatase HisIE [Heyndrickxia sporothermodurans]
MIDFSKGLIPAIIVDIHTNNVLMLAYMNKEAFDKTIETKETWFYSRSRKTLWNKGATSGNKQNVISIKTDCDEDSLLIYVEPLGPACHTGEYTCFYKNILEQKNINDFSTSIYTQVMNEIIDRKTNTVENSYTNYLFDNGIDKIGKKVIEEAGEVVIAAKNKNSQEIINECSDLLYHTFVLLANQNIQLEEIEEELKKRFAKKGNSKGERKEIVNW